jgi:hypothetical protein
MTNLHSLADYRTEERPISPTAVAHALRALGGAAHRDAIVNLLMGSMSEPPAKSTVTEAVDRVLRENAGASALFTQVFGPGSLRWMFGPGPDPREPAPPAASPALVIVPAEPAPYPRPARTSEPL